MRARGRILQSLSGANSSRDGGDGRRLEQRQAESQEDKQLQASLAAARGGRGGRILSQLAASRAQADTRQESSRVTERAPIDRENDPELPSHDRAADGSPVIPRRNRRVSRTDSDTSRSSALSQQFAAVETVNYKSRPLKTPSTAGQAVELSLNYMTFDTKSGSQIEEYHVDFEPNIESIRLRYSLLRSEEGKRAVGSVIHWTGTNLYLPNKLANRVTQFESKHPVTDAKIMVKLTYIKSPPEEELLSFYNSLMHKVLTRLRYVIINRQHYSPMHRIPIEQHKLEVWPGWVTSIQRLDGGIKMIVDSSFRVLRLESVRDILMEIKHRNRGMGLKEAFEQELVGSIVMTSYNNKAYRIDGIDLTKKPSDTFTLTKNNTTISYVDYMRQHWNVEVRDHNQPMLVHQPKPKRGQQSDGVEIIYLIPELCNTTGLTDEMRQNYTIMKAIADHTKLSPDIRETKLREFLNQMATDERAKEVFLDWNLSFRREPDVVGGRRLDGESIMFGNNQVTRVPENVDWTRAATSSQMFKVVPVKDWVLIHTERDSPSAQELLVSIREVSQALRIPFSAPRIVKLPNDNVVSYVNYGKREVKPSDQMVVILTPGKSQREDRYSACKRLYSCEIPVPCQFIRSGTISNPRKIRSICQKIVIQILSKVGGQPWAMKFPMKSFMIVGMDVYHDTVDRNKSCVGFVASMNEFTSSWWSRTFFQSQLEEIGQKLNSTLISALRNYHSVNGFVPQKIIIYRDGVGDGQLFTVLQFEVAQAMNAIKFYMRDSNAQIEEPHLSYVIVQKRINTKLSLRERGRISNPLPGTYLDHTITHPEYNDFYLVSQHVNQGTVSPTKYVLLSETGKLKLEHHQKLAYKLTHMYYNYCGTIRVPAPCQYAHKLAYLTGQNIKQAANGRLEDKLFYL